MTWPLNGSKAGGDLVLILTSVILLCKSSCSNPTGLHLQEKSREVCVKTRSPLDLLAFMGQLTVRASNYCKMAYSRVQIKKRLSVMHLSCKEMPYLIVMS